MSWCHTTSLLLNHMWMIQIKTNWYFAQETYFLSLQTNIFFFYVAYCKTLYSYESHCGILEKWIWWVCFLQNRFIHLNNFIQTLMQRILVKFFHRSVSNTSAMFSLELAQVINVSNNAEWEDGKPKVECREGLKCEMKDDVGKKLQITQVEIKN